MKPSASDVARFDRFTDKSGECWIFKGWKDKDGYGRFWWNGKNVVASWFAYVSAKGHTDLLILHTCDNPSCINPDHLLPGTALDNSRDMTSKNRQSKGVDHYNAKLSDLDRMKIKHLYLSEEKFQKRPILLAKMFDVHYSTIRRIFKERKPRRVQQSV